MTPSYHALHLRNIQKCPKCGKVGSLRLRGVRGSSFMYYQVDHYGKQGNSRGHTEYFGCCYVGKYYPKRDKILDVARARRRLAQRKELPS